VEGGLSGSFNRQAFDDKDWDPDADRDYSKYRFVKPEIGKLIQNVYSKPLDSPVRGECILGVLMAINLL
jgi:hypothetical protein